LVQENPQSKHVRAIIPATKVLFVVSSGGCFLELATLRLLRLRISSLVCSSSPLSLDDKRLLLLVRGCFRCRLELALLVAVAVVEVPHSISWFWSATPLLRFETRAGTEIGFSTTAEGGFQNRPILFGFRKKLNIFIL
jgi:hypothetical protein